MQEEPRKIEYRANKQPMKYGAIRCIFSGNLTRDKLRFIVSQIDIVPAVARTRIDSEIYTHIAGESCQRFGGELAQFVRQQFVYMITIKLFLRLALSLPSAFSLNICQIYQPARCTQNFCGHAAFSYIFFSILSSSIFLPPLYIFGLFFFFFIPYTHILLLLESPLPVVVRARGI